MRRAARKAFTLIELLVVITVIVVLLALLMPALDQAVYQAELVRCASQERLIVSGVTTYAAASRRFYPTPPLGRYATHQVEQLGSWGKPDNHLLPLVEPFIGRKAFNCPLIGGLSFDPQDNNNGPQPKPTEMFSTYGLWFATGFTDAKARSISAKGRRKLGDMLEYVTDPGPSGDVRKLRIGVVVGDLNAIHDTETSFSTHQDKDQVYFNRPIQDQLNPVAAQYVTYSRWIDSDPASPIRGALDLHFAYDDSHVERFEDVGFTDDPRMYRTPHHVNGANGVWQEHIPE